MGQGYEDHLITQDADIPEVDRVHGGRWMHSYPTGLGSIYLYWPDCSLKEEFLTVMPLTPDVGAQQIQLDKFFMVLTLIGLCPDLEPVRDQILVVHQFRPWMMCLLVSSVSPPLRLCHLISTSDSSVLLHGRPPRTTHGGQSFDSSLPQPLSSSASQASVASVAQPGSFLLYYYTTSALPTVTLANGSQTVAKGPEYEEDDCIGRESQGLYHLTSDSSPASLHFTDAPLLIHNRLGHPSLSKFQKMVPRFSTLSSLPCESCQLGKHTRVSFPKRLNNRGKVSF
ncbi:hypothetical protein CK203_080661 [Vitis vinifera]|uniref:GAG-pre-integrase domain-containing protein n=1 Tax=Vitis vinifera TaxID=29760 RepID=A0A438EZB4_VITVI|nr:hypothetical protein CK203_080661 [Vitis vinifera]